jgi:hypothetical protein
MTRPFSSWHKSCTLFVNSFISDNTLPRVFWQLTDFLCHFIRWQMERTPKTVIFFFLRRCLAYNATRRVPLHVFTHRGPVYNNSTRPEWLSVEWGRHILANDCTAFRLHGASSVEETRVVHYLEATRLRSILVGLRRFCLAFSRHCVEACLERANRQMRQYTSVNQPSCPVFRLSPGRFVKHVIATRLPKPDNNRAASVHHNLAFAIFVFSILCQPSLTQFNPGTAYGLCQSDPDSVIQYVARSSGVLLG